MLLRTSLEKISELRSLIRTDRPIGGEVVNDFCCLGNCGAKPFEGKVIEADSHKPWCLWNYYVECPQCGYQNNLAKYNESPAGVPKTHPCECRK